MNLARLVHYIMHWFEQCSESLHVTQGKDMNTSRIINRLALLGALLVIFGVGSAANQAFAATIDLNSGTTATLKR